jgi:hypothetical protein
MARLSSLLIAALLASGSPQSQDDAEFAQKVREMIVRLKDRNIQLRKKAEEDLFLLGPPALPILRAEESQLAPGDLKLKISVIIRRIERLQRQTIASGSTLLVTLNEKDRPIPEVLAELQKMTGVPIEHKGIPADAVTSLEVTGLSFWEAVDRICSTHGKLGWDVSEKGITVRKEAYVRPFIATTSGYLFLLRPFLRYPPGPGTGDRDYMRGEAVVAGPPGSQSVAQYLTYEALADDKGTNLLTAAAGLIQKPAIAEYRILPDPDMTRPLYRPAAEWLDAAPARGAAKVKTCKGVAVIQVVMEMERCIFISGPNLKKGARESGSGLSLAVDSLDISGGRVRMQVSSRTRIVGAASSASSSADAGQDRTEGLGLGRKSLPTWTRFHGTDAGLKPGTSETTVFKLQAALKGEVKPDAIELWEPVSVTDMKIPFEFKDVPMKKVK